MEVARSTSLGSKTNQSPHPIDRSPAFRIKSNHFLRLSTCVLEALESLIKEPTGYSGCFLEEFGILATDRADLQKSLQLLRNSRDGLTVPDELAGDIAEEKTRSILTWTEQARTLTRQVRTYLDNLHAGVETESEKRFDTRSDLSNLAFAGQDEDDLDDSINVDNGAIEASSVSLAKLTTTIQVLDTIADRIDAYDKQEHFSPVEVVAETAFDDFFGNISFPESELVTEGNRAATRDFLVLAQSILSDLINIAERESAISITDKIFDPATNDSQVEELYFCLGPTEKITIERSWITVEISEIPRSAYASKEFTTYTQQLHDLSARFKNAKLLYSEIEEDQINRKLIVKLATICQSRTAYETSPSITRLSGLAAPPDYIDSEISLPWRHPDLPSDKPPITCIISSDLFRDRGGRLALSSAVRDGEALHRQSGIELKKVQLFFDRGDSNDVRVQRVKEGRYGIRFVAIDEDGSCDFSNVPVGTSGLVEPTFIPTAARYELAPEMLADTEVTATLSKLMRAAPYAKVSAISPDRMVISTEAVHKSFVQAVSRATTLVEQLRSKAKALGNHTLDDPIVTITPRKACDAELSFYAIQIFGSDGREIFRLTNPTANNATVRHPQNRKLWREAYTLAHRTVKNLIKGQTSDNSEEVYCAFTKAGIGVSRRFAEELLYKIQNEDPHEFLAKRFLDPFWIVRLDRSASRVLNRRLISIGESGETSIYAHTGSSLTD